MNNKNSSGYLRQYTIAVLVFLLLSGCEAESRQPPFLNKFLVQASPKNTYEATFYNYGKGGSGFLGGTVSTPMYVNVRRREAPFDPERGQVLVLRHGYRSRIVWQDEHHLRIEYPTSAAVDKKQKRWEEVSVTFHPVPQSRLPEPYPALPIN